MRCSICDQNLYGDSISLLSEKKRQRPWDYTQDPCDPFSVVCVDCRNDISEVKSEWEIEEELEETEDE